MLLKHNCNRKKIVCLLNAVSDGTIPLENFAKVKGRDFDKHVVVLGQSQEDVENFLKKNYSESALIPHGLGTSGVDRSSAKVVLRYMMLMCRLKPDIVHAHHTLAVLLGLLSRALLRVPLIMTVHTSFTHFKVFQKLAWGTAFVGAQVVVCNSYNTQSTLLGMIKFTKTIVIYNGVDFDKLSANARKNEHRDTFRVGTVCRMVPAKDIKTLIRGFHKFLGSHETDDAELVLVGDGPEKNSLIQLVKELGISEQVIFKGHLSRAQVYEELGQFDIFVVSSVFEGFCNAMVEAAGAGKAIVATDIQPLPEVIGRNNANFFPAGDNHAMAEILKELYATPVEIAKIGLAAQDFVTSRYSLATSAAQHAELYTMVVNTESLKNIDFGSIHVSGS